MISNESSDQIEGLELLVPIIVVRKVLNNVFNCWAGVFELCQLIFGRIVCGFVIELVRLLFSRWSWFFYWKRLLRGIFSQIIVLNCFWNLFFANFINRVFAVVIGLFLCSLINVLLWLNNQIVILFLNRILSGLI